MKDTTKSVGYDFKHAQNASVMHMIFFSFLKCLSIKKAKCKVYQRYIIFKIWLNLDFNLSVSYTAGVGNWNDTQVNGFIV